MPADPAGNQEDCSWSIDHLADGHGILGRGQQGISMKIYSLTEEVERLTVQVGTVEAKRSNRRRLAGEPQCTVGFLPGSRPEPRTPSKTQSLYRAVVSGVAGGDRPGFRTAR